MAIPTRRTYFLGILFLAVPLVVWSFGWLSLPFAILSTFLVISGLVLILKRTDDRFFRSADITISKRVMAVIFIVVFLWCILGGQGGFLFQSSDWHERNAALHDLIWYDWPVVYDKGEGLCYYFGIWLVPALVGKICLTLGFGEGLVWAVANVALLLWIVFGAFLAVILFLQCIKCSNVGSIIFAVVLFVLFSGMDIIGLFLTGDASVVEKGLVENIHIEPWAGFYQFSSFTTQLFWVYNQSVPAWIATLLVLLTTRLRNDIFIGMLSAFLCPLPTMGLLFIGVAKLIGKSRDENVRSAGKSLLSLQNLSAIVPLLLVCMFFALNKRATMTSVELDGSNWLFHTYIGGVTPDHVLNLALFFMLECGILLLLVLPAERKNPYWWGALILLMVSNVVRLGPSPDFSMRASIPGLVVLLVMTAKHLVHWDFCSYYEWFRKIRKMHVDKRIAQAHAKTIGVVIVVCLSIGAVTPLVEMVRGPVRTIETHQIPVLSDEIPTFNNNTGVNFVAVDYNNTAFAMTVGKRSV